MSAVPAASTLRQPGPASPTLVTVRWLLRQQLRMARWAVGLLVVAATVATVLVDRYADIDVSIVQFGRQGFVWFPFSVAIMTTAGFVNVHVAAGLTRRALGRATLLVGLTMAAFYVAVMTALLQLERLVFGARGWAQAISDEQAVFTDTSQVGWIVADLGLVFAAAQLSGLLVGLVYYRGGGWWGTLTLPLTVGPVVAITPMLTTSLLDPLSQVARVPLAVAVLVATAAAYLVVLRTTPVRSVTS